MILIFSFAKSDPLEKGELMLNLGTGFSNHGVPYYANIEYALITDLTVGAELGYRSASNFDLLHINGFANFHFNRLFGINDNFDVYAGLNAGLYSNFNSTNYDGPDSFSAGAQLGFRWFIFSGLALNLEACAANRLTTGKLGISIKL